MAKETAEFIPTRRSLLTRLKRWDDQESWHDFFQTYWKLVYSVALKAGLSDTEAQEVVQETVISVAKKMAGFKYDPALGSFKSWLMQLTRRRIVDQFRKRVPETALAPPASDEGTQTSAGARMADPATLELERVWDGEWHKNALEVALDRIKRRVSPRHYQLFELNVLKEWPVDRIATTLHVSANQVYLAKGRVGKLVQQELKRLESQML